MKKTTEEYAMIGWLIVAMATFIIDLLLIWNNSCLSEYFGLKKAWWTECKSVGAGAIANVSPVNIGDACIILSFAVLGILMGVIYGKIKNGK